MCRFLAVRGPGQGARGDVLTQCRESRDRLVMSPWAWHWEMLYVCQPELGWPAQNFLQTLTV